MKTKPPEDPRGFFMTYSVTLISAEENETLAQRYLPKVRYEIKSEIYGCCIKLLCDDHTLRDTWEDNFYSMSQNVRSHGRLFVFRDPSHPPDTVLFDPHAKTLFLLNIRYYGWIKSLALSLCGDILEDEHGIWSVHGACLDINGNGLALVGAPGSGKTTQTYGLLTNPRTRIISDDWFFFRVYGEDILGYGSEKNFYIQEELATIWKEFGELVPGHAYDPDRRAVADVRWVIGKGRILPLTTIKTLIVLKRDPADPDLAQSLEPETALELFSENNYFNPHLLVRNSFKKHIRDDNIGDLLGRTQVYSVNTTGTPEETQKLIRSLAGVSQA
jgi:hypothetical protein